MNGEDIHSRNKSAVFAALLEQGLTHVVVTFDGYGDSGQITEMEGRIADEPVELPDATVVLVDANCRKSSESLESAIETMIYDLLGESHGGWQDGEGAYGEFVFDVAKRTILLDLNERFIESAQSSHEF
ncbi:MAG TPA: hypothetical protein VGN93_30815 [Shinella sp.]|jgi:hypothetical protein|uniref:DUF6878 family protein n=1 Tax=Shinella TaxID=323620 RepID=UPI0007DA4E42|nr:MULTISPECIES: DUF6878 family protein [Shinella]CAI0341902.1 conserved hypothetical protein [Rhizobiaceae bacterium]CAK7262359.1 conserved protein of unknown function [Shinella sp. WSC3-e]ANH09043.1 hypothetical protein shn_33495 [Shinella sp. HZN7]MDC7260349.1 hypothetical protein [Shinella sp. YE25]HEV7251390.1 hypothetical protein [Shinella sp.]